jgi:hypothetical protein
MPPARGALPRRCKVFSKRPRAWAVWAILAVACIVAVWPIVWSRSIPAFQQDWTWPLSRGLATHWLSTFTGVWDDRGLGGPNTLAWQTYIVALQAGCVLLLGPAYGLALWLVATLAVATAGCVSMLSAFGVRSWPARLAASLFYAFGPVPFTREAAGHLAYLVGYALLPFAIALGCKLLSERGTVRSVALGIVAGIAASQVQFYAIVWIAIVAMIPFVRTTRGWAARMAIAIGVSIAVQLQSLLPLLVGAVPSIYLSQRALLSWELNNSSPAADAAVMLGYFTHYYEAHALPGAEIVLYVLLIAGTLGSIVVAKRLGMYPLALCALGFALVSGLYGPFAGPLSTAFERYAAFTVVRDLHYFAALTAAGMALAIGLVVNARPTWFAAPALAAAVWIAAPSLGGQAIAGIIVPRAFVSDALLDIHVVASRGPGRLLWLPAEEPLGPAGSTNRGRDFATYAPSTNPTISDDYQNPELAYALSQWRSGHPDWAALARMDVRYVAFRTYLRSNRRENFGTGVPMGFAGIGDAEMGASLDREPHLRLISRTPLSSVYAINGDANSEFVAHVRPGAMRFSELASNDIAVSGPNQRDLGIAPSPVTADPRADWVNGVLGWRYEPWMPDSIYPFVWTISRQTLAVPAPPEARCLLAAATSGARLQPGGIAIAGPWRRYAIFGTATAMRPEPSGVDAVSTVSCDPQPGLAAQRFTVSSGYDRGWRILRDGRLEPPALADGWMMAWPVEDAGRPRVYLPAFAQLLGFIAGAAIIALSLVGTRRYDAAAYARTD